MSAEDMARALMAMDDVELRSAVAADQFEGLGELSLEDDERELLRNAARGEADDPEVEGFASFAPPYVPVGVNPALMTAVRHTENRLGPSPVQDAFSSWTGRLGAQGTW